MQYTPNAEILPLDAYLKQFHETSVQTCFKSDGNHVTENSTLTLLEQNNHGFRSTEEVALCSTPPHRTFISEGQSKKHLNPDLLRLRFIGSLPILELNETTEFGKFTLTKTGQKRNFKHIVKFSYDGVQMGEFLYGSNLANCDEYVFLKFNNELLYDSAMWLYVPSMPEFLKHQFDLEYDNIGAFDIACDGVFLNHFFENINDYHQLKTKSVITRQENGNFQSAFIGSRKGAKYIRYYNKTKELEEVGKKPYISQLFENLGFEGDAYRFELCLTSKFFNNYKIQYDDLFKSGNWNIHTLIGLFETGLKNLFEFVLSDKHSTDSKVNRRERIKFFDFSDWISTQFERVKRIAKHSKQVAKNMISNCIKESFRRADDFSFHLLKTASQIMSEHGLFNWLDRRSDYIKASAEKYHLHHHGEVPHNSFYEVPNLASYLMTVKNSEV